MIKVTKKKVVCEFRGKGATDQMMEELAGAMAGCIQAVENAMTGGDDITVAQGVGSFLADAIITTVELLEDTKNHIGTTGLMLAIAHVAKGIEIVVPETGTEVPKQFAAEVVEL